MRVCSICLESLDELRYQVLVSGLDQAFDSVDCAARAAAGIPRESSSSRVDAEALLRDLNPARLADNGPPES